MEAIAWMKPYAQKYKHSRRDAVVSLTSDCRTDAISIPVATTEIGDAKNEDIKMDLNWRYVY